MWLQSIQNMIRGFLCMHDSYRSFLLVYYNIKLASAFMKKQSQTLCIYSGKIYQMLYISF